jgi:hypothetical protein
VERLLEWAVKIPPPKRSRRRLPRISLRRLRPRKGRDSSSKRTQSSFEVALQDGPVDEPEPSGTWRVGPAPIQHNGELILPGDTVSAADLESDDVPFSGERMLQDLVNAGALIPEEQYEEPQARQAAAPQEGEVWVNYRDVDNRVAAVGGVGDETNARYVMATTDSEPINVPQSEGQTGTSVKVQPSATRAITNRNNG